MDGQTNPAPPKNHWNDESPVTNRHWFQPMVSKVDVPSNMAPSWLHDLKGMLPVAVSPPQNLAGIRAPAKNHLFAWWKTSGTQKKPKGKEGRQFW